MHEIGNIKTIDSLRGFGFITPAKGREVFFHVSGCVASISQLTVGDLIQFRIVGEGKRRRAVDVSPIMAD